MNSLFECLFPRCGFYYIESMYVYTSGGGEKANHAVGLTSESIAIGGGRIREADKVKKASSARNSLLLVKFTLAQHTTDRTMKERHRKRGVLGDQKKRRGSRY
jgi:hypothetical protein